MKRSIAVKDRMNFSEFFQMVKCRKQFPLYCLWSAAVLGKIPSEVASVEIAGISSLFRILMVGIIVQLADFVTAVNNRDA